MKTQLVPLVLVLSVTVKTTVQQPKSDVNSQQHKGAKNESAANAENKTRSKSDDGKEEKKSAEIESFIMHAQSVPAEFSADLVIQLVRSGKIKERKRRQDLLIEAFYTAAKAKQPLKLAALPGSAVDSRLGYRANAFRLGLDSLSLQSRAIKALLPLNKKRARQLFDE